MSRLSAFDAWYEWMAAPLRSTMNAYAGRVRVVEDASPEDIEALAALHDAAFPIGWTTSDLASLMADEAVITKTIRTLSWAGRGPLEGFIMVRSASDEGEVLTFAVATNRQGRGLGARLLDHGLMDLRQRGVTSVFLEVAEVNAAAIKLYRRRGFLPVGERPAYARGADGEKHRALVMRREYA